MPPSLAACSCRGALLLMIGLCTDLLVASEGDIHPINEALRLKVLQVYELPNSGGENETSLATEATVETFNRGMGRPTDDHAVLSLFETEETFECGIRSESGITFRIDRKNQTNVTTSEFGEFPWMAMIVDKVDPKGVYQCGGVLIHPRVIVTVAHCVRDPEKHVYAVRVAEWNAHMDDELVKHQEQPALNVLHHPRFIFSSLRNDIALVILQGEFLLQDFVNTACLPSPYLTIPEVSSFSSKCYVSGWGKTRYGDDGSYSTILKKVDVPLVQRNDCEYMLRQTVLGRKFKLHRSFLCAGGEQGKDSCEGDGGSPLVCLIPGYIDRFQVVGLVAWGIGCGDKNVPGVYVDVSRYTSWIDYEFERLGFDKTFYRYTTQ